MARLDEASVKRFEDEGYLVVENLLDEEHDIQPLVDEYTARLDELATQWYSEGKLASSYQDQPFEERLIQVMHELGERHIYHFEITLPFARISEDTPIHLGPAVFNLLRSPRILDAVESLIGSEIYCNPAHHIRMKLPIRKLTEGISDLTGTVHCHQDQSGTLPEADDSDIITVWLAINHATVANGCLKLVPGSHRRGLLQHVRIIKSGKHAGTAIPDDALAREEIIPVPVQRGGAVFMNARTIHGSLQNESAGIRWSADFRYHPIGRSTGRPMFPGFVARSRQHPEGELRDSHTWANLWRQARTKLTDHGMPVFHRWKGDSIQVID